MSWLSALIDRVSRREDALSLALFRIAMGSGAFYTVFSAVWAGVVPLVWIDLDHGGIRDLGAGPWLVAMLGGPTPGVVWPLIGLALTSAVFMTVGLGGRGVALATLIFTDAVTTLNGHAGGSYDQLLTNGLWLCVLAGGGKTLSIEARLRTGQWAPEVPVVAFPRWLAAYQLVLMYGMTGIQKVSAYWVPGGDASALYYIMQQPSWQRFDMSWVAWLYPLTQLSTVVTWFWEVLAPLWLLALWWSVRPESRTGLAALSNRIGLRWIFLGIGIVMHVVIFLTMDVGSFTYLSLGFYAVMVHPWEWRQLGAWLAARVRSGQGVKTTAEA